MNPQGPNDPNQGPSPLGGGQPPNNQPGQSGWPQQPPPGQYGQQPQNPYGAPQGQYPGGPQPGGYYPEQVNGTLILILGILSILGCASIITGPIAWVMGNNALKAIAAGQADPMQQGNASGGKICGIIGTILWSLIGIGYIIVIVIAIASGGASRSSF